jgi:hypothetical protein
MLVVGLHTYKYLPQDVMLTCKSTVEESRIGVGQTAFRCGVGQ